MPQRILLGLILNWFLVGVTVAATTPVQIVASAQSAAVIVGDPVVITLGITNNSTQELVFVDTERVCDYIIDIQRTGGPVPIGPVKRAVNCASNGPTARSIRISIKPGETRRDRLVLNEIEDMSAADTYTVRIGRILPRSFGGITVWSNPVSIVVKER